MDRDILEPRTQRRLLEAALGPLRMIPTNGTLDPLGIGDESLPLQQELLQRKPKWRT